MFSRIVTLLLIDQHCTYWAIINRKTIVLQCLGEQSFLLEETFLNKFLNERVSKDEEPRPRMFIP